MKNDEKVVQLPMQVPTNRYLFGNGGAGQVQIGQFFKFLDGVTQNADDIPGVQSMMLQRNIRCESFYV